MSLPDWQYVSSVFKPTEWDYRGDPSSHSKVDRRVVLIAFEMRQFCAFPFVVHQAYAPNVGHAPNSFHYPHPPENLTLAVDGHFIGMPLLEQFLLAMAYPWSAVGVYPYWAHPGLHMDLRPLSSDAPRPVWYQDNSGAYRYLSQDPKGFWDALLNLAQANQPSSSQGTSHS